MLSSVVDTHHQKRGQNVSVGGVRVYGAGDKPAAFTYPPPGPHEPPVPIYGNLPLTNFPKISILAPTVSFFFNRPPRIKTIAQLF